MPELEGDYYGNKHVSSKLQAVCDLYGPTDFTKVPPAIPDSVAYPFPPDIVARYGNEPYFYYTLAACYALGGRVADRLELAALANPVTHVDAQDPPFLIIHGEMDNMVPLSQSELLADALLVNGTEIIFIREPKLGHGFIGPTGEAFHPKLLATMISFFKRYLK